MYDSCLKPAQNVVQYLLLEGIDAIGFEDVRRAFRQSSMMDSLKGWTASHWRETSGKSAAVVPPTDDSTKLDTSVRPRLVWVWRASKKI